MPLPGTGLYGGKKEVMYLQADATSLADLKAETVRKKAEAIQNRQAGNFRPEKTGDKKKINIWSKENTGLLARMQRDMEVSAEEERNWQKSKAIMERKTKLYNSLKEGKGRGEVASNFLVKFDEKSDSDSDSDDGRRRRRRSRDYPAEDEGEEWVEYTDTLGRTRTCMKKDLKRLQRKDEDLKKREDDDSDSDKEVKSRDKDEGSDGEPDMLSEDMRREMLRQKWEKEEMENLAKDSLHYSDVRFEEARAHGAGFYAFSKDEDKRSKEQVTLKKLHEETEDARKEREKKAVKRKRDMAERIYKIKQKRREKMGLPPLEDLPVEEHKSDSDTEADFTKSVVDGLKMFRQNKEEEEKRRNEIRRRENLRDWDLGKEGLSEMKKEWKVMTQQEWLDKQRTERNTEFAPPTTFNEARSILQKKEEDFIKLSQEKRKLAKAKPKINPFKTSQPATSSAQPEPANPTPLFKVPARLDPMSQLAGPVRLDPMSQLAAPVRLDPMSQLAAHVGLDPMSQLAAHVRLDPMSLLNAGSSPRAPVETKPIPMQSYSTAMRLDLHRRMQEQDFLPPPGLNSRIINEMEEYVEDEEEQDEEEEEDTKRGQRTEIAPPCSMDYYSSVPVNRARAAPGFRSHEDMASAFQQGLSALKK